PGSLAFTQMPCCLLCISHLIQSRSTLTCGRGYTTGKKGPVEEKRGEHSKNSYSSELQVCEVPIIPFMLRQEMADMVRRGLIKHCCHNQCRSNMTFIQGACNFI
uniref:Insulin-like domain-containing protein n=1 Tax=Seriola lalandi dorsalis TaxID=1841481 RepID=A0A3B4WR73_SERLL